MSAPDTSSPPKAARAADTARRDRLLVALIIAGMLLALLWSYTRLSDSRRAAVDAAEELGTCRDLAARIDTLRGRPAVAEGHGLAESDLHGRIAAAAAAAEFPDGSLGRIDPEPSRRVGETPYREDAMRVNLHHVTLRELFTFLHALAGGSGGGARAQANAGTDGPSGSGLRVKSIRLSAPRGEETGDRWTVEATLTYLVYDPKPAAGATTPVASLPQGQREGSGIDD
jgi:hypothetical protein